MAIFAIGDIHGCLHALETVLRVANPMQDDTLVFLGDYVDRGPSSRETIDFVRQLGAQYQVVTLKGNHEIMMMRSRVDPIFADRWFGYGGKETLQSYGAFNPVDWDKVPADHWSFMEQAGSYHVEGPFIFVHAGLEPGVPLYRQTDQAKYWEKYVVPQAYSDDKIIVCGHTARKDGKIADFGHTICLDTYAYGGQWLTCLDVTTGAFCQGNQEGVVRTGTLASLVAT